MRPILPAIIFAAALTGCSDATAPQPQRVRVMPEWVVGDAAAALDSSSGSFRLSTNPIYVSTATAETVAVAVARSLAAPPIIGNGKDVLAVDRGGPIDYAALKPCERLTYVVSPISELPPEAPGWVRRAMGSHFAIPLCGRDGTAQLSLGIPDNAMDIRVVNGSIVFRAVGGGEDFNFIGVPIRFPTGLPLTPEEAVAAVVVATGRRIASVPVAFNQLDSDGAGQFPLCASWRMQLDRPAAMFDDATGSPVAVQEVFVHHVPACFGSTIAIDAASDEPPPIRWVKFPEDTTGYGSFLIQDSVQLNYSGPVMFRRLRASR